MVRCMYTPTLFILCSTPQRGLRLKKFRAGQLDFKASWSDVPGPEIMQQAVRIAKRFRAFQIAYDQAGASGRPA